MKVRVNKNLLFSLLLPLFSSAVSNLHLVKGDLTLEASDQYESIQSLRGAATKLEGEHRHLILSAFKDPKEVTNKQGNRNDDIEYIWHLMSPSRQEEAWEEVTHYLKAIADILTKKRDPEKCNLTTFGTEGGTKYLCEFSTPPSSCKFISFGISSDYSFDTDIARKKKCRGFAADPTVVHPSRLETPLVTFHNIGAKMLHSNYQQSNSDTDWWITSVPSLRKFLNIQKINVLKMDCEGCEYALARDVVLEEGITSDFFHRVDQFSLEVHMSKVWVGDKETIYYLGLLYKLLDEAGLKLHHFFIDHCSPTDESVGCMPEFMTVGYPACPAVCHNYLFAKKNLDVVQE